MTFKFPSPGAISHASANSKGLAEEIAKQTINTKYLETAMKTLIATIVAAIGIASIALPAAAGYIAPDANPLHRALNNGD